MQTDDFYRSGDKDERVRDFVETASDIVSGAAGPVLGFLAAGSPGAVVGSAAAPVFHYSIAEFAQRMLSRREKARASTAMDFAAAKIQKKREAGYEIRGDGFFQEEPGDRSAAAEVLEGVLLAAQREPQEKKLKFYGNLMANVAFDPEVSRDQANFLISLAEGLSYRQLCLLKLLGPGKRHEDRGLRQTNYMGGGLSEPERVSVMQEVYDLYRRGLVESTGETPAKLEDIAPAKLMSHGLAFSLHNLMELGALPSEDLERTAQWLR